MAKKKQHGGKREGAGRKVANPEEGRTMLVAVTVPSELVSRLDDLAANQGWSRSKAVTEAIRGLLDVNKA
jgi:hypothetical protein